jgi:hypothetical protein
LRRVARTVQQQHGRSTWPFMDEALGADDDAVGAQWTRSKTRLHRVAEIARSPPKADHQRGAQRSNQQHFKITE